MFETFQNACVGIKSAIATIFVEALLAETIVCATNVCKSWSHSLLNIIQFQSTGLLVISRTTNCTKMLKKSIIIMEFRRQALQTHFTVPRKYNFNCDHTIPFLNQGLQNSFAICCLWSQIGNNSDCALTGNHEFLALPSWEKSVEFE